MGTVPAAFRMYTLLLFLLIDAETAVGWKCGNIEDTSHILKGFSAGNHDKFWPEGRIPWNYIAVKPGMGGIDVNSDFGIDEDDLKVTREAMRHIEDKVPCIKFEENKQNKDYGWVLVTRTAQKRWNGWNTWYDCKLPRAYTVMDKSVGNLGKIYARIYERNDKRKGKCFPGASAFYGPLKGEPTMLFIGASTPDIGLMVHELLHNLHIGHTHKRPDAKYYIRINRRNIEKKDLHNYEPCDIQNSNDICRDFGTPYDCSSVMHYQASDAISAIDKNTCDLKTYHNRLTKTDIQLLKKMYCELPGPAKVTVKEVYMSSSHWAGPPKNCKDGDKGTFCHTRRGEKFPWVALTIPRATVRRVRITNRPEYGDRTRNMKVYVGDKIPSSSSIGYRGGQEIGTFPGPGKNWEVMEMDSDKGVEGSVVVVQMSKTRNINLGEIEIFADIPVKPTSVTMSSIWPGTKPNSCVDGNKKTFCHSKGGEKFPWLALRIPRTFVQRVRITNRESWGNRMTNMKVYVDNMAPYSSSREFWGQLIGTFRGPGKDGGQIVEFTSNHRQSFEWVVVQMETGAGGFLNLAEIEIFGKA